ncbi:MAG: hypothetical protein R2854_28955 [Caldilineaceae bacterium]
MLTQIDLVEDGPIFLQRLAYPQRFAPLIERKRRQPDWIQWYSTVWCARRACLKRGRVPVAAAQGLAQIIPDTGNWVAERIGYPDYRNDLLYLPAVNLKFGAITWTGRDYLTGICFQRWWATTQGPGNADRWRERPGSDDPLYVETLEYREPRIYVQAILSNLYHYVRLYGKE